MKTSIGGDRLGSGNKSNISLKNYYRSTHDLSETWRSSMSCGTLVPFLKKVALPGDTFDIDLACEVLTLPTIGPLFGSFKVQLDVFQIPIRLYNASLHMNKLGIGMDMSSVYLPRVQVMTSDWNRLPDGYTKYDDGIQMNKSALLNYLGIAGNGIKVGTEEPGHWYRPYNAVPLLAYWDIYKNYYANKQEERGYFINTNSSKLQEANTIDKALLYRNGVLVADITFPYNPTIGIGVSFDLDIEFNDGARQVLPESITFTVANQPEPITEYFESFNWNSETYTLECRRGFTEELTGPVGVTQEYVAPIDQALTVMPFVAEFPLENIDLMRERILQAPTDQPLYINWNQTGLLPYSTQRVLVEFVPGGDNSDPVLPANAFSQQNLALKTYQSDLFNNWISTEWIDGANGVNAVTAVDTTGDSFTIDALNLANKVYNMLNRIAISGGTYDDWLDAVYTHERSRSVESPVYMGSLIKELAFQEVVSTADTQQVDDFKSPLGTLAGRGRLTNKNKGGTVKIKVDEPSYIMGIVSITPRVDYSQGNDWDVNLNSMNDFHKPALDAIGYQDLITEQMAWQSTEASGNDLNGDLVLSKKSAGKQPAWINYMTSVNKTYGNFAIENKEMFMTLNRRYEIDQPSGAIADLTTYIDPSKYNFIFAQTSLDAQNFWVQISSKITARRKMSAKVIPNL